MGAGALSPSLSVNDAASGVVAEDRSPLILGVVQQSDGSKEGRVVRTCWDVRMNTGKPCDTLRILNGA